MSKFHDMLSAGFLAVLFNRALAGGRGSSFSLFALSGFALWWVLSRVFGLLARLFSIPFRSVRREVEKEFRKIRTDAVLNGDVPGTPDLTVFSGRTYVAMTLRGDWRSNVVGILFLGDVKNRHLRIFELPFGGEAYEIPLSVLRESGVDPSVVEMNVSNAREIYRKLRFQRY